VRFSRATATRKAESPARTIAVELQCRAVGRLPVGAEVDPAFSIRSESRVERAVAVEARDAEVAGRSAAAGDEDSPVGLDEHDACRVGAREVDPLLPCACEGLVDVARSHASDSSASASSAPGIMDR
jgi:hypothetical protein